MLLDISPPNQAAPIPPPPVPTQTLPAQVLSPQAPLPSPDALIAAALDGLGLALFVVDAHGRIVAATRAAAACAAARDAVATLAPALVRRARRDRRSVGQAAEGTNATHLWIVASPMPETATAEGEFYAIQAIDARGPSQVAAPLLAELCGLTPAESQVVRMVADGLSPKLIAIRLGISLATVKTHLHRGFRKSGARGQADLVRQVARIAPQHRDL